MTKPITYGLLSPWYRRTSAKARWVSDRFTWRPERRRLAPSLGVLTPVSTAATVRVPSIGSHSSALVHIQSRQRGRRRSREGAQCLSQERDRDVEGDSLGELVGCRRLRAVEVCRHERRAERLRGAPPARRAVATLPAGPDRALTQGGHEV